MLILDVAKETTTILNLRGEKMRCSSKLTVAIHILLYIIEFEDKEKITSETLSTSISMNVVNIRKIISQLKSKDLIRTRLGVGGTYLAKSPKDINLKMIFSAVEDTNVFKLHNQINEDCKIAKIVKSVVDDELLSVENVMFSEMEKVTLEDIYLKMEKKIKEEK